LNLSLQAAHSNTIATRRGDQFFKKPKIVAQRLVLCFEGANLCSELFLGGTLGGQ
jgi:hypothetical protein